ncbi:unnamed protein product, partial [Prorocentrum cordatum]
MSDKTVRAFWIAQGHDPRDPLVLACLVQAEIASTAVVPPTPKWAASRWKKFRKGPPTPATGPMAAALPSEARSAKVATGDQPPDAQPADVATGAQPSKAQPAEPCQRPAWPRQGRSSRMASQPSAVGGAAAPAPKRLQLTSKHGHDTAPTPPSKPTPPPKPPPGHLIPAPPTSPPGLPAPLPKQRPCGRQKVAHHHTPQHDGAEWGTSSYTETGGGHAEGHTDTRGTDGDYIGGGAAQAMTTRDTDAYDGVNMWWDDELQGYMWWGDELQGRGTGRDYDHGCWRSSRDQWHCDWSEQGSAWRGTNSGSATWTWDRGNAQEGGGSTAAVEHIVTTPKRMREAE